MDDETPLSFLVTFRVQLPTSPAPVVVRPPSARLSRAAFIMQEGGTGTLEQLEPEGYRRSVLGVKLPRVPKKAAREETVSFAQRLGSRIVF